MATTTEPPSNLTAFQETDPNESEQLLDALMGESTIFIIRVSFPRFTKKLSAIELGLSEEQIDKNLISLGQKKLLGKQGKALEVFSTIESRIQAFIDNNSFQFLAKLRCVPNTNLETVVDGLKNFEEELSGKALEFCCQYEEIQAAAIKEWEEYAEHTREIKDKVAFMNSIRKAFPPIDKVQDNFKLKWVTLTISAPKDLSLKLTSAAEQRQLADARSNLVKDALKGMSDQIQEDVETMISRLRTMTYETLTGAIEAMNTGKLPVHQKTLNTLGNFIEKFRKLNFAGDVKLDQMLDGFEKEYLSMSAADYRRNEDSLASLQDALANLKDGAEALMNEDAKAVVSQFSLRSNRKLVVD
jgi:hypothetical protein